MNVASAGSRQSSVALVVAGLATLLTLGLRVEGDTVGRTNSVRVFLVAAIVLIAFAALSASPNRSRKLTLAAVVMLGITIALIVGNAAPQGLIVLLIALSALVWARKAPTAAS